MSAVKLLAIFAENRMGQLARVTRVLAEAGINIRWVTIATSETFGVIKLLVDRFEEAYQHLRQDGLAVSRLEVLAVQVEDCPGGLHRVAECLARNKVNVENSSGFVSNGRAVLLIEAQDILQARRILQTHDLCLLTEEETVRL